MAPLQPEIKGDKAILRGEIYRKDVSRFSIAENNSFELFFFFEQSNSFEL